MGIKISGNQRAKNKKKSKSLSEILNTEISFSQQLSLKKKEAFYSELEVLIKAGLDLKTALDLLESSQSKPKDKALFATIRESVISGNNLSTALENSKKFSKYEIYSIQIAEESGKLYPVLADLAFYFNKNIEYRRLLIGAISYPILVIGVAILALVFLLNFLVPLFGDLYSRLGQDLPYLTQLVVNFSKATQKYFSTFLISTILLVIILYRMRHKNWFRNISSQIILRIPILGSLLKKLYLVRFIQAMSFLLRSKVPILDALSLIQKMIGFYPIEKSLTSIQKDILQGKSLYESINIFPFYPDRMRTLIKVGEETHQLESMFAKMATQYNNEVEQQTKMLGNIIEPILIVVLALVVGVVLVSMYLPIFRLVTTVGM